MYHYNGRKLNLNWGNIGGSVDHFVIYRNGVAIGTFADTMSNFVDEGANPFIDHDYKLEIFFSRIGRTDSVFSSYKKSNPPPPIPYCASLTEAQNRISSKGLVCLFGIDTILNPVTNIGSAFSAPKSTKNTLIVGTVDNVVETLVVMGEGDSCGLLYLAPDGKVVAARLSEYDYVRGIQSWVWYDNWVKMIKVDWRGISKPVNSYEILRDGIVVGTQVGVNGTGWYDTTADRYIDHSYRIRVFYGDFTVDSSDSHYDRQPIPAPVAYCGSPLLAQSEIDKKGLICFSFYDTLHKAVVAPGGIFAAPKSPGHFLVIASVEGHVDTFVVMGLGDSCEQLFMSKEGKVVIQKLDELQHIRGATLNVWYHDGMQVLKIHWNGIIGNVDYFELLRDGQVVLSNYNGSWMHDDYSADAFTNHTYLLRVYKGGIASDSLTALYVARSPYNNPVVWCGSPSILQDTLSRHGSSLIVHWDSLPIAVSRIDNPFTNSKYSNATLMLGEWFDKEKNLTVTDTMVAMGVNGNCSKLIMSKTLAAVFWRLKDCYMLQPPHFSAWWNQDSNGVRIEWGNFKRPVKGYILYRDTTHLFSAMQTNVWNFLDQSAQKDTRYQYRLNVNYEDSTSEWFYVDYSNGGDDPGKEMSPIYCGTDAMLFSALVGKSTAYIVPWDTVSKSFARLGNPFLLKGTSNVWAILGKEGSNTYADTFLALGKIGICSDPLFSKDAKTVMFARIYEYPFIRGPRLLPWFYSDSNCISIHWGGFKDTIISYTLFRDNQFIKSFSNSQSLFNDFAADPNVNHSYFLIVKRAKSTDTLYSNYSKDGDNDGDGGEGSFNFEGKWGFEGSYTFNLMKMTGNKADSGKSGYVYRWGIKRDSIAIDSLTGNLQIPVSFNVSFRKINETSYKNLLFFTVRKADSCSGYNVKDTSFGIGIYQKRIIISAGTEKDTLYTYFTSGVALPVGYNNVITVNLSKIASVNLELKSNLSLTDYAEDGKLLPLPTGDILTFTHSVPNINIVYKTISYNANGVPFGIVLMAAGMLDGGRKTIEASPAKEDGYVTFDGTVRMEIEGDGIPKSAFDMQESGRQDKILFSSLRIYAGSTQETVRLPLDSAKITFNSGSDFAGKRIRVKGVDTLLGITVDAPAGRVFHLGASDKTVIGIKNGRESRYFTVAAAVMAGEKNIRLPANEYKGMPIAIYKMSGITITGESQGEQKTVIDADGNDAGIWLKDVAGTIIRGLSVRKGDITLSANGISDVTVAQSRVTGSLNGIVMFTPDGVPATSVAAKTKNCIIENCVMDSISGFAILIDRPVDCRIVNNTIVSNGYGAYLGRGGNSSGGSIPLSGNIAANNIFKNCKGGVVQGLDNSIDNIGFTFTSNVFQRCDSGAVLASYTTDPIFSPVKMTTPAGSAEIGANENAISASFPYIPVIGSSVHDKGLRTSTSPLADFRGSPRVLSNPLDIGAFELFDLTMGFALLSKKTAEGCAFVRYSLTAPDSGSFSQVQMVLKKDGAAFTAEKTLIEQKSNAAIVTWYPLVNGSYVFDFSTKYTSTVFDTTFTLSDTFVVKNDEYIVKGSLWNMVGYADASESKAKNESSLSLLSDSSLYVWDQTASSYSLLSTQTDSLVRRGCSYWNMPDSDLTISWTPEVYSTPDTSDFVLNLKGGWNLVSSPYPFAVAVPGMKFWHYDNIVEDYRGVDLLRPLAGSWVLSDSNTAITLKYKPALADSAFAAKISGVQYKSPAEWSIALKATVAGKVLEGRIAGVSTEAEKLIEPLPPIGPSGVSVWFHNSKETGAKEKLFKEMKAPGKESYEWLFVVEPSARKGKVEISGEGIEELNSFSYAYVGSPSTGFTDLKHGVHTFNTDGKRIKLVLIVTNDKGIMERYSANFSLAQNTPNPFNPITSISFFVPLSWDADDGFTSRERFIELNIFDIRGKRMATLSKGAVTGGKIYTVNFDAKNSPSGVYLCKLASGKYESIRKMLLVR
jgi:hypothetical protein